MKRFSHWLILIIGAIVIINLSRSIADLLDKGKIIEETRKRLELAQRKNKKLKEKLAEVKSPAYIEKQARDKLNLAKEGEVVVILPKITPQQKQRANPVKLANWQKWLELFK